MRLRSGSARVWIIVALSCAVALFAVHESVTRSAFDASRHAESLVEGTLPNIDRLATVRSTLRHIRSEARTLLHEPARGRTHLDETLQILRQEIGNYLETPPVDGEAGGRARLREVTARMSSVDGLDPVRLEALIQAADEGDSIAAHLIESNTSQARQAAHAVTQTHASASQLSLMLLGAFVVAIALIGFAAVRLIARVEHERETRLRELDAFAARVAHDLKNPLSPCTLALGVLRAQKGLDDAGRRSIERAESGIRRAIDLIDALLSFARAGGTPAPGDHASVDQVCHEVAVMLASVAKQEFATIELAIEPGLEVQTSAAVLESMIGNLVKNACLYLGEAATNRVVSVRAHGDGRWVTIDVEDRGPGIPHDVQRRLFRPFERGSSRAGGNGLGLATVRRLAEAHGGSVSLASTVGSGSTFTLRLPKATRPVPVLAPAPSLDRA